LFSWSSNILTHAPEMLELKLIFATTLWKIRFRSLPVSAH
jgi:hypothetical protein